jgi:hypothetical protein
MTMFKISTLWEAHTMGRNKPERGERSKKNKDKKKGR